MDIRRIFQCCCAAGFTAVLLAADPSAGVPFAQLPPAVQKAVQAQAVNGKVGEISRDEENGVATFVVEITKGAQTRDYSFDEAGTLVGLEMMLQETPVPVQLAVRGQVGQGTVESVQKTLDGGQITYEVDWKSRDGADHSFSLLESGKLDSMDLSLQEAPPGVQASVAKELNGAVPDEITKMFDEDGVSYVVVFTSKGVSRDMTFDEAGKMLSRQAMLNEVPKPVQQTIVKSVGGGKILRIDHVFERRGPAPTTFEVDSIVDGKPYNFAVGQGGKFFGVDP